MITTQQAKERVRHLDAVQLRALTKQRLLGQDTVPVGSAYDGEPSEDLVIQLLRADDLPQDSRDAVLDGCLDVYIAVFAWLASRTKEDSSYWRDAMRSLCRAVNIASPEGLRPQAFMCLTNVVIEGAGLPRDIEADVKAAAVWAAVSYFQTELDVPLWQQVMNNQPELAAYAFNALLAIDPWSPRIEQALCMLWRRQVMENWPIDAAFLTRRAARARGSEGIIRTVLSELRQDGQRSSESADCWRKIETELARRPWTRSWTQGIRVFKPSMFSCILEDDADQDSHAFVPRPVIEKTEEWVSSEWYLQAFRVYTRPRDFSTRFNINTLVAELESTHQEVGTEPAFPITEVRSA